jgi:peroxiredoxin
VQILGINPSSTFSQKTFADSLKLPYPLLSDFPDGSVIRRYGVLAPNQRDSRRAFFLIDERGIVRARWLPGDETLLPSEEILKAVRTIAGKR